MSSISNTINEFNRRIGSYLPRIIELKVFQIVPRVFLYFFAIPVLQCSSTIAGVGFILNDQKLVLGSSIFLIVWFFIMFLISISSTDRLLYSKISFFKRGSLIIFIALIAGGLFEGTVLIISQNMSDSPDSKVEQVLSSFHEGFSYNDSTALTHQAINNLLNGENPYIYSNVVSALSEFNPASERVTPLRVGRFSEIFPYPTGNQIEEVWLEALNNPDKPAPEFATSLCYPAGDFLLPVPFILMGIDDLRIIYLILILLSAAYVIYALPSPQRFYFLGALLISLEIWNSVGNGDTGALVFPFLLLGWFLLKRNIWISALFMGLAIATKQTAWFFLPFYLIAVFKINGLKNTSLVMTTAASLFLAINLPFIVLDYRVWLNSIFMPMGSDTFPIGFGIITLVTNGIIDIRSPLIFNIMEMSALILGSIWYFYYYEKYPNIGPVLAILPFFFAWRSLIGYFFYTGIILLALILDESQSKPSVKTQHEIVDGNES